MNLQLEGKRALVTGSNSGIGEAIAAELAREGAAVVVHGRNAERAGRVARRINAEGGRAVVATGDLASPEGVAAVCRAALGQLGAIDILVNNAGIFERRPWMEVSPEDWELGYRVNVVSMVRMIHALAPAMQARGWGRIIQISSRVAIRPRTEMPDYSAGKAAILNLTVSLAKELAPHGVCVNSVTPGIVLTPEVEAGFRKLAAERGWGPGWREIERSIMKEWGYDPAVRLGRPEDVAHVVAFLSSPLADAISGANIRVDGGGAGSIG